MLRKDCARLERAGRTWMFWFMVFVGMGASAAAHASITLTATVNGQPSTQTPGIPLLIGSPVTWEYTLTNGSSQPLRSILITHRGTGLFALPEYVCYVNRVDPGKSHVCSIAAIAKSGVVGSKGAALGLVGSFWVLPFEAGTKSYYEGIEGLPALTLSSDIDGDPADATPGPELFRGRVFTHRQVITNSGHFDLTDVTVTRQQVTPDTGEVESLCSFDQLLIGEERVCETRSVALEGAVQYALTVTGVSAIAGNTSATNSDFYTGLATLSARPRANPQKGNAPLAVRFTPDTYTDAAIQRYEWDFDGNGTIDRTETVGANQSYTYNTPGTYNAFLRVTDNRGAQASGTTTVEVLNAPPVVQAEASPSNGGAPLTVTFTVTAQDSDGIDRYEWDFDGDSVIDQVVTSATTSHIYSEQGIFRARVTVYDRLGAFTTLQVPTVDVEVREPGSVTVAANASPATGNAPLAVNLNASVSGGSANVTSWQWDFDGDGVIDHEASSPAVSHTFTRIGTLYSRVTALLDNGSQVSDRVRVEARASVTLTRSRDSIDPALGETVSINTTLNGVLDDVEVRIESAAGQLVRRLYGPAERSAGSYQDVWDGRDDSGALVARGQYRALMRYSVDGVEQRLDPGLNTGGTTRNPPRSSIPRNFSPFAGDPLEIDFTLSRASEVTAFMGLFNQNVRLVTFLDRQAFGTGTHRIIWNGEGDDGRLVQLPPGESFLFGIWSYDLPDNAIFVNGGVHASGVSVAPVILTPGGLAADGDPAVANVRFTLNRPGDIELTISDLESGLPVARFTHSGLVAGQNTVTWDGRDNRGNPVAAGQYRIGVTGISDRGQMSTTIYALLRVYY